MDKETINEFGYIAVTAIIASIMILLLTGIFFASPIKTVFAKTVPEHESVPYENDNAYIDYAIRQAPIILVDSPIIATKENAIDLTSVVNAVNADGVDISENAVFYMDGERINAAFKSEKTGSYNITVYVPDKLNGTHYGKVAEKTFEILVIEAEETTTDSSQSAELEKVITAEQE